MKNLMITTIIIFLSLLPIVHAQTFRDKVIISPEVEFLWNFQRGFEELYRYVKFSPSMKIDYSLELGDRRIGEMEALIEKNRTDYIVFSGNAYEREINNIQYNLNSTIFTIVNMFEETNTTIIVNRLKVQVKVLQNISAKLSDPLKTSLVNISKKTSKLADTLSKGL